MDLGNYSNEIQKLLVEKGIRIGDRISVKNPGKIYEGLLMPKSSGDPNTIVIKLANGYNTGIAFDKNIIIEKKEGEKQIGKKIKIEKLKPDPNKPNISILTTGGTIASRVDYKTGGVISLETPEEIVYAVPELAEIANIRTKQLFQMWSEDMEPYHWMEMAKKVYEEIQETRPDGIIITHGTDTMHYTSVALSFMLQDLPIPVLLVGSQRSSDRGSSDGSMNLICAAQFISKSDFSGVSICMHGSSSDNYCNINDSIHVKKMHTSRRDAFKSINVMPYAKVEPDGTIEYFRKDYKKKDKIRKPQLVARFEKKIALIKIYPGFDYKILEDLAKDGYRGIVLEGFALGHAPISVIDDYTKNHTKLLEAIRNLNNSGILVIMTSQTPYGVVNLNIYSDGRLLQDAGVIPLPMTSEAAFVKLGWVLGHTKDPEDAKKMMLKDQVGEFTKRIDPRAYEEM